MLVIQAIRQKKILTSLEAHTVPIYFGNPDIKEDINPDSFINVNDFNLLDDLMLYIQKVDSDDDLWCKYVSAPWLTSEQENYHVKRTEEYRKKMEQLLSGAAERRAIGTAQYMYRENFFKETSDTQYNCMKTFKHKVNKVFRKLLLN